MIKHHKFAPKMQSTYYLKPGQTLKNTKIADRSLALLVSKSTFDHFVDYTTENKRLESANEEKAAKLDALKKASYEMSKSWDNTIANIQKHRKKELLMRKEKANEAREQFVKDLAAKNAVERAAIVKEARKLLLWKKPQCRLINGALLTAECYRQLDAQLTFQKTLERVDEERDMEYAKMIGEDDKNWMKEEKKKAEKQLTKNRIHASQLKNQIEEIRQNLKQQELDELKYEKEDLKNMAKEIRMVEELEAKQAEKRKKELKKLFIDTIDEKKFREMELKRNEEFENRALEVFKRSKKRIERIGKTRMEEAKKQKRKHSEILAIKCVAATNSREAEEKENIRRAAEEKEALEQAKNKRKKQHEEKVRADIEMYRAELATIKERRAKEEKDIMAWETLQRFKRDDYNKEVEAEVTKREAKKKIETAQFLRLQMAERDAQRQRERLMGEEAVQMKANIDRTNEKVLAYGEQVLKECEALNETNPNGPTRPLFPILKAIQKFKKESGLIPPTAYEESPQPKGRRPKKPALAKCVEEPLYL